MPECFLPSWPASTSSFLSNNELCSAVSIANARTVTTTVDLIFHKARKDIILSTAILAPLIQQYWAPINRPKDGPRQSYSIQRAISHINHTLSNLDINPHNTCPSHQPLKLACVWRYLFRRYSPLVIGGYFGGLSGPQHDCYRGRLCEEIIYICQIRDSMTERGCTSRHSMSALKSGSTKYAAE